MDEETIEEEIKKAKIYLKEIEDEIKEVEEEHLYFRSYLIKLKDQKECMINWIVGLQDRIKSFKNIFFLKNKKKEVEEVRKRLTEKGLL